MISNGLYKPIHTGLNALVLKDFNSRLVRQALKHARKATVKGITETTGLSMMTVSTILQSLVDSGAALEDDLIPSNGGRPSRLYRFNEIQTLILVIFTREIKGINTVFIRVADLYGRILESEDLLLDESSPKVFDPIIDKYLNLYPAIGALGFGLPGIEYGGTIIHLDYRSWIGAPIIEHFKNKYNIPVLFENDVNAAVMGRGLRKKAPNTEVYIYFPEKYPPGAGIRINGQLLKGQRHFAGEVGWLPLGIPWGDSDFIRSERDISEAVAKIIVSLTAVLNPESIIIFSEFLTQSHFGKVRSLCTGQLPEGMVPELIIAENLTSDFETGIINLTLSLVEQQ